MSSQSPDPRERRAHPRFSPDPHLPVFFTNARTELQAAGHIVDISEGGLRLVSPPACPVPLVWNDPLALTVGYSEAARAHGMEGLTIRAVVVRVQSDASAFTVNAQFRERSLHERLRDFLAILEQSDGAPSTETVPMTTRR